MKKVILLTLGISAIRAGSAATLPMLAGEAYYWLWGQRPAAGYFDHPPMVGLMGRIFGGWIYGSELAARSSALILGALTILAVYGFARSLFPEGNVAWRSVLFFSVAPLFSGLGVVLQPDNSLIPFMVLTWWLVWEAIRRPTRWMLWLAAGLTAGLALLSKFHAWVMLPPVWMFALFASKGRRGIASPGPWLALIAAFVVLSPNLFWNASHDWLNYAYQWRRSDLPESRFEWENVFHFLAGLLTLSPLGGWLVLWAMIRGLRVWRGDRDPRLLYLLLSGAPLPLFLGALSFVVTISVHWAACGYIPLIILGMALIERGAVLGRKFLRWLFATAILMTALAHAAPMFVFALPDDWVYPLLPKTATSHRLKQEIVGWRELGDYVGQVREDMNRRHPTVIMAKNWHLASLLAFYSETPTEAFALEAIDAHNFALWMDERGGLKGLNAVVVIKKSKTDYAHADLVAKYDKYHRFLDPLFETVLPTPSLICYEDGSIETYWGIDVSRPRLREFLIFGCYGFKGELAYEVED